MRDGGIVENMKGLGALFLSALPPDRRAELARPDLDAVLTGIWERGREAHPTVHVEAEELARALGARRAEREFALERIVAADLYLALGCVAHDRHAIDTLERTVVAPLARKLRRGGIPADRIDAVIRDVRESMLVATPRRPPKLALYTGQVPLSAFALLIGKRELAAHLRRSAKDPTNGRSPDGTPDEAMGPEGRALLDDHRADFEGALAAALSGLPTADRALLRWSVREGRSIDAIAPRLGVDRATVARRIARARRKVADDVRAELRARLRLGDSSFDSLCHAMVPELDLSLSRLL